MILDDQEKQVNPMWSRVGVATILWLLSCCAATAKNTALDDGVFAMYNLSKTAVTISLCGSIDGGSGCFGFARMHPPFERACAVLEGLPSTNGNVISRDIYILDERASASDVASLYVYTRTDTFSNGGDTLSVVQKAKVPLTFSGFNVTGGEGARCSMVASDVSVFAGTTASDHVGVVNKSTLGVTLTGGGGPLVSLFVDERGYVSVDARDGFLIVTPDGRGAFSGGGHEFLVGTRRALTLDDVKTVRQGNPVTEPVGSSRP